MCGQDGVQWTVVRRKQFCGMLYLMSAADLRLSDGMPTANRSLTAQDVVVAADADAAERRTGFFPAFVRQTAVRDALGAAVFGTVAVREYGAAVVGWSSSVSSPFFESFMR